MNIQTHVFKAGDSFENQFMKGVATLNRALIISSFKSRHL